MARPRKCRRVCGMPRTNSFAPMGSQLCEERIIMAVDEYETIRLIDLAGYTQEECAAQMGIARTTVQGIYNDARRKLADALVNGKMLFIEGGDIDICERENAGCCRNAGQPAAQDGQPLMPSGICQQPAQHRRLLFFFLFAHIPCSFLEIYGFVGGCAAPVRDD